MKIFWLFNHPAPYKVSLFNELGRKLDLTVCFERKQEKGRNAIFYGEEAQTFSVVPITSIPFGAFDNYTHGPISYLKKHHKEFDLIVINGWRTLTEQRTIAYLKRHKIPYVFYINGGIIKPNDSGLARRLKRKHIPGAMAYFAPDDNSAAYLKHYGAEGPIYLYPYASVYEKEILKVPYSEEETKKERERLGIVGEKVFVSSSQFIARKNNEQLLRIFEKMPENCSLYLIGEGEEKENYQRIIKEMKHKNVFLLEYKDHASLFEFYRCCDCFVTLSKEDIYGHTVNEALSQGLPVICSDQVNSGKHLLQNGINGFVVSLENEEAILDALNYPFGEANRLAAIKSSEANTYEAMAKFHQEAFASILEKRG